MAAKRHGTNLTREELIRFRREYGSNSDKRLAQRFRIPIETVAALADTFRLAKDKAFLKRQRGSVADETPMPRWTGAEVELLKATYATRSNLAVARRLGRSVKSVVSKAHALGLRKDARRLTEMGRENRKRR